MTILLVISFITLGFIMHPVLGVLAILCVLSDW